MQSIVKVPVKMVIYKPGNHASVIRIEGDQSPQSTRIQNTCLSFIHCHMASKDKTSIREVTCGKFEFEQLKTAREVLYTTCEPDKHYGYNGPHHNNNPESAERKNDAFNGIYSKLVKLDASGEMPSFSVPSDELLNLLMFTGVEHKTCEKKFEEMKKDMDELKRTFHSFVSVVTSSNTIPAIPPITRSRLVSTGSVKRGADDLSEEETEQTQDESEADKEGEFKIPRKNRSRHHHKKIKINNERPQEEKKEPSYSDKVKMNPPRPKPPSTWGSAKPSSGFKGAVSDIFMYNCDADVTTKDIEDHFQANGVTIKSIEKRSHDLATRTSFRLSPATQDGYDKIMQGDLLPEQVAVRRYVPRRWNPTAQNSNTGRNQFKPARDHMMELDQLGPLRSGETAEKSNTENTPKST